MSKHKIKAQLMLIVLSVLYALARNHAAPPFTHRITPPSDVIKANKNINETFDKINSNSRFNLFSKKNHPITLYEVIFVLLMIIEPIFPT